MTVATDRHGGSGNVERYTGGGSTGLAEVIELIGLYWHFVDIVWIVIFTLVYLIPS